MDVVNKLILQEPIRQEDKVSTPLLEEGKEFVAPQSCDEPQKDIIEPHAKLLFKAEKPKEENENAEKGGFDAIAEWENKPDNKDHTSLSDGPVMLVDTHAIAVTDLEEPGTEDKVQYHALQHPLDVPRHCPIILMCFQMKYPENYYEIFPIQDACKKKVPHQRLHYGGHAKWLADKVSQCC